MCSSAVAGGCQGRSHLGFDGDKTHTNMHIYMYLSCEVWSPLVHAMAAAVRSSADAAAAGLPHRLALRRCGYGGGCEGLHQQ